MSQHPEIIAAPLTIWVAPVGTAFPALIAAPEAPWELLGKNGARSFSEAGVTISYQHQWVSPPPPAGRTASTVAMLEAEDLRLRVELLDLTLERYAIATAASELSYVPRMPDVPGTRSIGLSIGPRGAPIFALLARGPSPYLEGKIAQYELPVCQALGSPQPMFRRGQPAGLALEFRAFPDPAATSEAQRFGRLIAQDSTGVAALRHDDGRFLLTSSDLFLEI